MLLIIRIQRNIRISQETQLYKDKNPSLNIYQENYLEQVQSEFI